MSTVDYYDYDEDWYDSDDYYPPKEEPDCGGCNDRSWVKAWGYRRLLARIMPLALVWLKWRGLLHPLGTLGGSWPCSGCNPCWIDTWWPSRMADRIRWWRYKRRMQKAGMTFDDEAPF